MPVLSSVLPSARRRLTGITAILLAATARAAVAQSISPAGTPPIAYRGLAPETEAVVVPEPDETGAALMLMIGTAAWDTPAEDAVVEALERGDGPVTDSRPSIRP